MTFFLSNPEQIPEIKANTPRVDLPGFSAGLGAAFSKAQMENNANFRLERETENERLALAEAVSERVGLDAFNQRVGEEWGFDHLRKPSESIEGAFAEYNQEASNWFIGLAREMAEADPQAWADLDLTDEGLDARVNGRLQAEYEELDATVNLMGAGRGWASLLGGMGGVTADAKNIPFLLFGGGGSVLRAAGRGAMINVAAETAFIPDQIEMAERLGIEAPDIPMQLAIAAAGGAAFDGGITALANGFRWMKMRGQAKQITDFLSEIEEAQALDAVEDALATSDGNPSAIVAQTLDEFWGRPAGADEVPFAPIGADEVGLPEDEAAKIAFEQRADQIDEAILASDPVMRFRYPLAEALAERGGIRLRQKNAAGEWEPTAVATELRNMGIDPKQHLRLFRKDGHADLDNLVASEFDGLDQVVKVDPDTGYFDRDELIRALGDELSTGRKTPMNGEIAALMAERDAPISRGAPLEGRTSQEAASFPDGFTISPDEYRHQHGGEADARIGDDVHGWLSQHGYVDLLTQDEYAGLVSQMKVQGGSLDDYMDRIWDDMLDRVDAQTKLQEAQYDEVDWREIPVSEQGNDAGGQGSVDAGGQPSARSDAPDGRPGGSRAPDANDQRQVFEETAAGEQRLISGVSPITSRDRLNSSSRAALSGGDAPADFGLFDVSGRSQQDLFSDISSKDARTAQEAMGTSIRDQIEELGDFEIDLGDGKGIRAASAIMDEIENVDDFVDVMQLCGRKA